MSKLNKMREQIANQFIAALQQEKIPWHKDWHCIGAPHNAVTGRGYHGLNYFWLSYIATEKNYTDPRWCTFNQAKEKIITMYHSLYPEGRLYQLTVSDKNITETAPHPLYLGIQAKYHCWNLKEFIQKINTSEQNDTNKQ